MLHRVLMALPLFIIFPINTNTNDTDADAGYRQGAVAAEHPTCSKIGVEILQEGGSAVDAAIAALLCVGVINNFASGIGGGGFGLIYDRDAAQVIDFRETAPQSADEHMFDKNPSLATNSTLGVGVPGEIAGFWAAHQRYGRIEWERLFAPAIKLAEDGFKVTPKLASMIERFQEAMRQCSGLRAIYLRDDGTPKQEGEIVRRPNLANTLKLVSLQGPKAFYQGFIAQSLAEDIKRREGGLTMEDLANYRAIWRAPLEGTFAGHRVLTAGPPTSGPIVLQLLQVLEGLSLANQDDLKDASQTMHLVMEAYKFAYVDRMKLGDPDFVPNIEEIVEDIVGRRRAQEVLDRLDHNQTHPVEDYFINARDTFADPEQHGTTHITGMDRWGQVAIITDTVNTEWGIKRTVPEIDVIPNDEMDDFSSHNYNNSFGLPPSRANYIAPGKRPQSSSSPVILIDPNGRVRVALGAAGGSRIITAVVDSLIKLILWKWSPSKAVESCRLHHQLVPNLVVAEEDRCPWSLLEGLMRHGHRVVTLPERQFASTVNLIVCGEDGLMIPVSDSRKGGIASGF